jgi:serine/threonine-protein kinase
VVHLDLKPENIFLTRDSQVVGSGYGVKLLDLGLARVLDDSQNYSQLQGGTPEYMAPEQQRGGEVSPATDVWAIGLLGFRLLCGEGYGPVVAESEVSATRRAAALGIGARLDAGFDRWFARCLHRSPKERYADAEKAYAAFLQEVRSAAPLPPKVYLLPPLPQPDRTADPAQLRQSRRVWALLPATLLFGTALGYFVGAHRASSAAQATHPPSARRADPAPLALPTAQPSVDLGIPSADQKSLSPSGPQEIPLLREQRPAKPTAGHTLRSGKDSQPRRPAATENRTPKSQELPKSDGVNFPEN